MNNKKQISKREKTKQFMVKVVACVIAAMFLLTAFLSILIR